MSANEAGDIGAPIYWRQGYFQFTLFISISPSSFRYPRLPHLPHHLHLPIPYYLRLPYPSTAILQAPLISHCTLTCNFCLKISSHFRFEQRRRGMVGSIPALMLESRRASRLSNFFQNYIFEIYFHTVYSISCVLVRGPDMMKLFVVCKTLWYNFLIVLGFLKKQWLRSGRSNTDGP